MKVLILTGGNSSERTISFISARNVQKALQKNGHNVKIYDLRKGYQSLKTTAIKFEVLFPVLHGEEGEGGKLHKFLSKLNKPIVGTRNYKGLEQAWHKIPFKKFCDKNGITTAKWQIVKNKKNIIDFGFPCVLKASNGGSSREVVILKSEADLKKPDTNKLLNSNVELFVEKYIKGIEITVGTLNNKALPILEIIPPKGSWFNYSNKYSPKTKEIPNPSSIPMKNQQEIKNTTLKIHKAFDLGSYSRIDYMFKNGNYYVLEVNTIPGLTPGSLMPKQAKAAGLSFTQFLEELLKTAS